MLGRGFPPSAPMVAALALAVGVVVIVFRPSPSWADHPPECSWEFGGAAEVHPAPCNVARPVTLPAGDVGVHVNNASPVPVSLPAGDVPVQVNNAGPVAVTLPAGAQSVRVDNTTSQRVPVDARCVLSDGSACSTSSGQPAAEVTLSGDGGLPFANLANRLEYGLGLLVFVAFAFVAWSLGRRRA